VAAQPKAGLVRLDRADVASVALPANACRRKEATVGSATGPKCKAASAMKAPCLMANARIPLFHVSPFDLFVDLAEWLFGFRSP